MADLPIPELSSAILIGASTFTDLSALPAVHNNLRDLKAALTNKDSGILPADRCRIVDNPKSTGDFMKELRAAASQAEDFFLVYYGGHGVRDQVHPDRLYLAVRETDEDGPDGTAVSFESVRAVIENSMANRRVLILDCCYSGLALGAMSGSAISPHEVAVRGTAVITSSPKNSVSLAPPGERYTAFTGELITLLRQGSRVAGEPLTVGTAFRSLRSVLATRSLPEPKLKLTDTGSDILLRRPAPLPLLRPAPIARPIRKPIPHRPAPAAAEPRTVPALRPVPPPGPVPQTRPGTGNSVAAMIGWLLLQTGAAIGLALVIGGFGTAMVTGAGISSGITGLIIAVVCAIPPGARIAQLRKQARRVPRLSERIRWLAKVRRPLLITGLVVFALIAVIGAVSAASPQPGVQATSATTNTTMVALFAEAALACAFGLLRKGTSPVTGDVPSTA
jgi:hypothetical protein